MAGTSSHVDGDVKPKNQITGEKLQYSTGASVSGSDVEARARSLEDSLQAAERALKNKEETVRLQAESLALAEERLASRNRNDSTGCHFGTTDFSKTELQTDCTCGLVQENMNLKKTNETLETQIHDLRQRVSDLQEALENKENLNQRYQGLIQEKDEELQRIKDQLSDLKRDSRDQGTACNTLACEIKQLEGLLTNKSEELVNIQRQCVSQETIITQLKKELEKADAHAKENASVRREVWSLTALVAAWRRQLAADARPRHLAQHYAEKCSQAEQLRASLREARAGGAALCVGARAALRAARDGLRALADHARENEEIISQQESLIRSLRERSSKNISSRSIVSDDGPCCSKYLHRTETRSGDRSFVGARETPHSRCASSRARTLDPAESETVDGSPPPAPPRRLLRKKPLCVNRRCQWPLVQEASVCCTSSDNLRSTILKREFSADSLLERVERTHEALELAHRRWCRHEHRHDLPAA